MNQPKKYFKYHTDSCRITTYFKNRYNKPQRILSGTFGFLGLYLENSYIEFAHISSRAVLDYRYIVTRMYID